MIHHVSIPARDPEHVARVLAELLGGYAGPFIGPIPGAFVAYAEDRVGTGIEVYPERTVCKPGADGGMAPFHLVVGGLADVVELADVPAALAFHALLSVKVDRATIERIGEREGWRTQHFWRGPGAQRLFEVYEMWIENRVLFELVTEDMVGPYADIANGPAQRRLLAARAAAPR